MSLTPFKGPSPDLSNLTLEEFAEKIRVAHLAAIVDSSDDAVISKTLDGRILSWNTGATRLFGYRPEEIVGKSINIIIPPELVDEEIGILARLRIGELIDHFETTRIAKNGRRIRVSLTVSPVRDASGNVVAASKIARDIDIQKHAERLDAQLAAIVGSSDDAIVSKSLEGVIQSWNAGATRIFGYTAEEAIGQPITLIIPPELHAEERGILEKIRKGLRIEHYETNRVAKDGRVLSLSLSISPIRAPDGTVVGAAKIGRDITERKRAEEVVRESERQLSHHTQALEKLSVASTRLWRADSLAQGLDEILSTVIDLVGADKGNIQLLNPKGDTLSIVAHQGFGQDFLERFCEVTSTDESACGRVMRNRERIIIDDVELDLAYGPYLETARNAGYRSLVSTPLVGADGGILGVVSAHFGGPHRPNTQELRRLDLYCRQASDFIQRMRLEHTLRESEEALREADRRKDEFLALLAHELRNPLAPIRYVIAAGRKAGRTAAQRRLGEEVIERQVAHMSRLLDDLLDISRITGGTLQLRKQVTELAAVVDAAIEAARPVLEGKNHRLSVALPKQTLHVDADPVRLAQVFSNLLINAAKYTDPNGHIELLATQESGEILVAVRDNGIGISEDMLPRLFTLFCQASSALERSEGGLGVGLALARGLVELHGGRIEAHSEGPGLGSEFAVRLPLVERVPTPAVNEPRDIALSVERTLKILVVDDNKDSADSCTMLLQFSGHEVRTAYSGSKAIELAQEFCPHAILLDIGLPDINGYDVARTIRSTPLGRHVVLVAITGWGQEEDRRRALEAGIDHHLTKPVEGDAVESVLNLLCSKREPD